MPLLPKARRGLTGWAKATASSAIALLISLGLCGLNFGVFTVLRVPISGNQSLGWFLTMIAFIESAAILLSAATLLISLLGLLVTAIVKEKSSR